VFQHINDKDDLNTTGVYSSTGTSTHKSPRGSAETLTPETFGPSIHKFLASHPDARRAFFTLAAQRAKHRLSVSQQCHLWHLAEFYAMYAREIEAQAEGARDE
jgi:hypothetical protein